MPPLEDSSRHEGTIFDEKMVQERFHNVATKGVEFETRSVGVVLSDTKLLEFIKLIPPYPDDCAYGRGK